jgi:hypothetical protein
MHSHIFARSTKSPDCQRDILSPFSKVFSVPLDGLSCPGEVVTEGNGDQYLLGQQLCLTVINQTQKLLPRDA